MKLIPLTQGKFAQVDDEDYEKFKHYKWYAHKDPKNGRFYAWVNTPTDSEGKRKSLRLHRVIINITDSKILIDHADGDGLNCQKFNLRRCTASQNGANRRIKINKNCRYLGVTLRSRLIKEKTYTYYVVTIKFNKVSVHLGQFPYTLEGELAAAWRYDLAAQFFHGEFANLNFKK